MCQPSESPDGGGESEVVWEGGGGGDHQAGCVHWDAVQGEMVLVMSLTVNLDLILLWFTATAGGTN